MAKLELVETIEEVNTAELVFTQEGGVFCDSLIIAAKFGKEPKHVNEGIRNLECSEEFKRSNFRLSSYTSVQGKEIPKYLITKDGFMMLAMGFTGAKACRWKEQFIKAFNAMEQELRNKPTPMQIAATMNSQQLALLMSETQAKEKAEKVRDSALATAAARTKEVNTLKKQARKTQKLKVIASVLDMTSRGLNTKLSDAGWQVKGKRWEPTELGLEHSEVRYQVDAQGREWPYLRWDIVEVCKLVRGY